MKKVKFIILIPDRGQITFVFDDDSHYTDIVTGLNDPCFWYFDDGIGAVCIDNHKQANIIPPPASPLDCYCVPLRIKQPLPTNITGDQLQPGKLNK